MTKAGRERGGLRETHLGFLTGPYQRQAPALPQRLGDRGPGFRYWLQQTVTSFGTLGFSQAETLRDTRVIQGMRPLFVRNYASVSSNLSRLILRSTLERAHRNLARVWSMRESLSAVVM